MMTNSANKVLIVPTQQGISEGIPGSGYRIAYVHIWITLKGTHFSSCCESLCTLRGVPGMFHPRKPTGPRQPSDRPAEGTWHQSSSAHTPLTFVSTKMVLTLCIGLNHPPKQGGMIRMAPIYFQPKPKPELRATKTLLRV